MRRERLRFASAVVGLLGLLAIVSVAGSAGASDADDVCAYSTSVGKACKIAGPMANQPGVCESVPCSSIDGGPDDVANCTICSLDHRSSGNCSGGMAIDARPALLPAVGGCCSVAGAHSREAGAGLVASTFLLAVAMLRRRRAR